ncbi:hypothetical protein FQV37_2132 [Psychrobacter nivimaris]|uniref:Uncharacterized protein n=1 Tax=Psychrobacter nivimaris TaxID=281738 RepID=A0A6N7BV33_9GAMM|nr:MULTISPECIES: hypothetical protein [Psychrobacter]KAF0567524.1 hypothetical protein FQV37_2132 [Psychrobacter nivimaris]PLT22494.1 hypothetical protein CXF62_05020 [Psychrobacter sp. MES7-P7E]|tara:strand:+ start:400 stop:582 length:183 start_codon:yes stop_codon:yes gene_type:complete
MGNPYGNDHDDHDDDAEELNDADQQKENDEIQEMGKQGLTDQDFPKGRPLGTFSSSDTKK